MSLLRHTTRSNKSFEDMKWFRTSSEPAVKRRIDALLCPSTLLFTCLSTFRLSCSDFAELRLIVS